MFFSFKFFIIFVNFGKKNELKIKIKRDIMHKNDKKQAA
jgi:hypothetical protein